MMDHNLIAENMTAVRYLQGELTDAERDVYEEHYFECPECAEELRCGAEFMDYAREVALEDMADPANGGLPTVSLAVIAGRSWFRPAAMAACGLLAVGLALGTYREVRMQRAMNDQAAQIVYKSVVLSQSRSIEDGALPSNKTFRLKFVIPPGSYKAYRSVILGPSNAESFPREITVEEAKSAVDLVIAAGSLAPGDYAVVIRGLKEDSTLDKGHVLRLPFRIEIQK